MSDEPYVDPYKGRACPICAGKLREGKAHDGERLAVCRGCGCGFADEELTDP